MDKAKVISIPMRTSCNFDKHDGGKPMEEIRYQGMIGSLLYLNASHHDIMLDVCLCVCLQATLKESHLTMVKRIIRYLIGTPLLVLWYPNGTNCDLVGYFDSNFTGCKLDWKSTKNVCHLLGNSLISFHIKKQAITFKRITFLK